MGIRFLSLGSMHLKQVLFIGLVALWLAPQVRAQESADRGAAPSAEPQEKRLFGIIPNYRTSPGMNPYVPLTTSQKFKLAGQRYPDDHQR